MNTATLTKEWVALADDISALKLIQIWGNRGVQAELEASAEEPTSHGKLFSVGDTIITDRLEDIGTAGKLWGRAVENIVVAYE